MKDKEIKLPNYLTVSQFVRKHPWPPEGGLRYLIFNEKTNGFDKVIKRAGRTILIDEEKFFKWIEDQNKDGER